MKRSLHEILDVRTMPRVPAAQIEADEDAFCDYLARVGAVVLVGDDGTEDGIVMSKAVGEAFMTHEAEVKSQLAAARAEHDALLEKNRVLQWKLTHLVRRRLRRRCDVLKRIGLA